ncbi:MAG: DUF3987 domain-containing protein, partial [Candidatus Melainabacteria bacterium]|nr:DUF3987 domain-containing protein [Candidatus Melainabacteria bacterium]
MNMKQINTLITETPAVEGEAPRALVLNRPTAPRFPIEAMPNLLKEVIHAIQATTQAPLALCSQSVLAAASLVAQAYINVEVLGGGIKPCSLFCITIAESGERKTTVDNLALKAIKTHEEWLRLQYNLEFKNYNLEKEIYDAQKKRRIQVRSVPQGGERLATGCSIFLLITIKRRYTQMPKGYQQLTAIQRSQIHALKSINLSNRRIAKVLAISHTTINNELKRNTGKRGYRHQQAHKKATARKHQTKPHLKKLT